MEERKSGIIEKSVARITNLHNAQNLNHALTQESRAVITPEKLSKVRFQITQELLPLIGSIQSELGKYQSVMEELKKIENIDSEKESIGKLARKIYREQLQTLCDKVEEIKGRY
jgi:hypothetical protein